MEELLTIFPYFESSCYKTPEFGAFAIKFKRLFKKSFPECNVKLSAWHFYLSGFIEKDWKYIYISTWDVRPSWDWQMLYRTAKNDKDFTGWSNHYTNVYNYKRDIDLLFNQIQ